MKIEANDFLLSLGEFSKHKAVMIRQTKSAIEAEAEMRGAKSAWVYGKECIFLDDHSDKMLDESRNILTSFVYSCYLQSVDQRGFVAEWKEGRGWC